MNWQHLVYFKVIVETQNFSRAAEQLYVTPSTLSKAIHALETEVGFSLFKKDGRMSVLTESGKTFKSYVDQALECIDSGMRAAQQQTMDFSEKIRLTGIYTMCADYLPAILKNFTALYPQATFSMLYQITSMVLENIQSESSDLGFCGDFDLKNDSYHDIERCLLHQENLILIVPQDHKLAEETFVDFTRLKDETFIAYSNVVTSAVAHLFWRMCSQAGITPHISFEAPDDHTIIGLVSAGLGIAMIPDSPSLRTENVHVLRFPDDPPQRNLYMVWKKNRPLSPAVRALRDFVLEAGVSPSEPQ